MTIEERKKKLWQAQQTAQSLVTRIRRLNTALKRWERRVKMHEKAIAELERDSHIRKTRRHIEVQGESHEQN
jgi:hypothetical protein